MHRYSGGSVDIVHIDFYRLESQTEIEEAGIEHFLWEDPALVLTEWISRFPDFEKSVLMDLSAKKAFRVSLAFVPDQDGLRSLIIEAWDQAARTWVPAGPIFSKTFGRTSS